MKLLRYGEAGRERPGALDSDGNIRDLSSLMMDVGGSEIDPDALSPRDALATLYELKRLLDS